MEREGVIQSITPGERVIVLVEPPQRHLRLGRTVKPSRFVWTDDTLFMTGDGVSSVGELRLGDRVKLSYRYVTAKQPPYLVKVVLVTRGG